MTKTLQYFFTKENLKIIFKRNQHKLKTLYCSMFFVKKNFFLFDTFYKKRYKTKHGLFRYNLIDNY